MRISAIGNSGRYIPISQHDSWIRSYTKSFGKKILPAVSVNGLGNTNISFLLGRRTDD